MPISHHYFRASQIRGIKRVEYEKLAELGFFGGEAVELLYGLVVRKDMPEPSVEELEDEANALRARLADIEGDLKSAREKGGTVNR